MKKISLNEKIFVAGANGMVGSAIVRTLKKYGYGSNLYGGKLLIPDRNELNLLDLNNLENWFLRNKPTIVVLAAAKVGGIIANSKYPADFLLENLKIQTNVIESAWKFGTRRLLFLGSSCIYPKFCAQPIKEEYLMQSKLEETNEWYAIAKIAGIKLCEALRKQHGFDSICLMPTNLYGPGDNYHPINSHVMASLIAKFSKAKKESKKFVECLGTGKPLREFLHVNDLGDAVLFCLENWDPKDFSAPKDSKGRALTHLNVGSGLDLSILQLAEKISEITGFKGEILWDKTKPDGTPKKQLNIDNILSLGWSPKITLDQGLKETIKIYQEKILG